jgi:hypothetical protein|tara:strand:- start:1871 stop:2029 length:159 start_codon:yes stop_codon:yes gene_type:complete
MARITKTQSRKRILEAITKLNKVHQGYYLTPADNMKVFKMCMELEKLRMKLK